MTYTLYLDGSVQRDADGAWIPADAGNADWQEYQTWLAVPNTPTPAVGDSPPDPTNWLPGMEFLSRITDAEYNAIMADAALNIQMMRWIEMLRMRGQIDLYSQEAIDAKAYLTGGSPPILTTERADIIFADPGVDSP